MRDTEDETWFAMHVARASPSQGPLPEEGDSLERVVQFGTGLAVLQILLTSSLQRLGLRGPTE